MGVLPTEGPHTWITATGKVGKQGGADLASEECQPWCTQTHLGKMERKFVWYKTPITLEFGG